VYQAAKVRTVLRHDNTPAAETVAMAWTILA